jgi:hypothetical protein
MKITLYQTLEDRGNPVWVEDNGPLRCNRGNAWLGDGYYFWDSHIQLAHYWGEMYKKGYMICAASAVLDHTCWDLHNNANHRIEFEEIYNLLIEIDISRGKTITVAHVIGTF